MVNITRKNYAKHTNELKDLRKIKVQLTRELRQEFIRHRQAEQAKAREIATLKRVKFGNLIFKRNHEDFSFYCRHKCKKIMKFEHYVLNINKKK